MGFSLSNPTKVKVLDVRTLAAKDRKPDEPPGAQLLVQAVLPVEVLKKFDAALPAMMFRRAGGGAQQPLEGIEGVELTSIGKHVKRLPWAYEQSGCKVTIERATTSTELEDCKVHRVSLSPQEGGGIRVQWTIDAPALHDDMRGMLTGLKATEVDILLSLPEVDDRQQQIPGTEGTNPNKPPKAAGKAGKAKNWPFREGDGPQPDSEHDATSAFVDAHGAANDDVPPEFVDDPADGFEADDSSEVEAPAAIPDERTLGTTEVTTRKRRSVER